MKGILKQLEKQQRVMQTDLNFAFSDEDLAKSAFLLYSVWFFQNELKDDDITQEPMELLKFWKENVFAFILAKF